MAKQLTTCYGMVDPCSFRDPQMLPVPSGAKPNWVASYLYEEEINRECLQELIPEDKEKRRICPLYAAQLCLPTLLPGYDPNI
eukprot:5070583-Ditylum_brightwellii.AAC.2